MELTEQFSDAELAALTGRMTIGDYDMFGDFGLILSDEFDLGEPEPRTNYVDIAGVDGTLDLSEAIVGDILYEDREQEFTFYLLADYDEVQTAVSRIKNAIHGRKLSWWLAADPDYTYTGRMRVESVEKLGQGAYEVSMTAVCEPYKLKEVCTYTLDATGGQEYVFPSGRQAVHPIVECENDFTVIWNNVSYTCDGGTAYRLHYVTFTEGENTLYINSKRLETVTYDDVNEGGALAMTWDDAASAAYTWDGLQRLQWYDDSDDDESALVYVQYEWRDL